MGTKHLSGMWADPRTGIYYLRKRIPARLRAVAHVDGRRVTGHVIKLTTGTADAREAARRWPGILARYAALEADWERLLRAVHLTPEQAKETAALWIVRAGHDLASEGNADAVLLRHVTGDEVPEAFEAEVARHARAAADLAGLAVSAETWPLLIEAMREPVRAARFDADRRFLRASEQAAPNRLERVAAVLPRVAGQPKARTKSTPPALSLTGLYAEWKAKAVVKPRTADEAHYTVDLLVAHLGHDDAALVDQAALRGWRDAMLADGRRNNTWNNRLSMIRAVLAWGVTEGKLPTNPADGLRLKKNRPQSPLPYSDAEAVQILTAARSETRASLRWAHWVMAFSGMRAGEVLQLTARDIRQEGGLWFMAVHEDDATKSVKSSQRRNVPVHPALAAEGFIAYAQSLEGDAPLFPDKKLDKHGNRGGRAWNVIGKWVRQTVGITDPQKAPDHSWRHRVEDELRAAEVPEDARDAITGHARQTTGRQYGVRGDSLKRLHRSLARIPVPDGLVIPGYVAPPKPEVET
jgi:integrase